MAATVGMKKARGAPDTTPYPAAAQESSGYSPVYAVSSSSMGILSGLLILLHH